MSHDKTILTKYEISGMLQPTWRPVLSMWTGGAGQHTADSCWCACPMCFLSVLHYFICTWSLMFSGFRSSHMSLHLHFVKAASNKMLQIIEAHTNWPVACLCWCVWTSTSLAYLPTPNLVRRDTCWHNCAVERELAVGSCGQLHHCNWPCYPAAWFQSPSSVMVSAEPFLYRSGPMPCNLTQMGPCQIIDMRLWSAAD